MLIAVTTPAESRRGVVLLAVLVVVVILALAAYQYSDMMLSEYQAAVNTHRAAQKRAFAESAIHYTAALISSPDNLATVNGNIFDNPAVFQNIAVGDAATGKSGRFSLIAPPDANSPFASTLRHGVIDEGGKINVNALMMQDPTGELLYAALLKLPGMTSELAACLADWVDGDDTTREGGAEIDYYSAGNPPMRTKNGPLDSLEELLFVKGMSREILFGNDLNRNGLQDAEEGVDVEGFSRGLSEYLTIYSREHNTDVYGQALTYVDETDLAVQYEKLSVGVGDDLAKYVIMYRQYGPANSSGQSQSLGASIGALIGLASGKKNTTTTYTLKGDLAAWAPDFEKKSKQKIASFYDLVNSQVSIPGKSVKEPATIYQSPLNDAAQRRELLPKLFQTATIFQESELPARININTAPPEVLAAIPNLSEADVQAIVQLRPPLGSDQAPDPIFDTPAWLYTDAKLKIDSLKKIEPYITTRSQVFRVQALGYFDGGGAAARLEAVIDTNNGRPRIMMWRDLTELGSPKITK